MVVGKEGNADDLGAISVPSWSDKGKAPHAIRSSREDRAASTQRNAKGRMED